ncbi:serine/threonine protein kinase [Archangium violaceum]|nr:serine/threonine protein kinase [Archangium violaceum]
MVSMKATHCPILITLTCLGIGCTGAGVSLRADGSPGPQPCAEKALEAMRILRLRPGDSASIVIDANQSSQSPVSLTDGPVESYLTEELGYLSPLTRLYGQIWTGGPNVMIRYYEARPPDGEPIPLCAVARLGRGGLQKKPDSPPGVALIDHSRAAVFIVDAFR